VALPPLHHLQPPLSSRQIAGRRLHHLPRYCGVDLHLGLPSVSSGDRRRRADLPFLLVGIQYLSSGRLLFLTGESADVAVSSSGIAAARSSSASPPLHPNPAGLRRRPLVVPGCARRRPSLRQAVLVRRPRFVKCASQPRRRLRPRLRVVKPCTGRVSPPSKDRHRSHSLVVRFCRPRAVSAAPVRRRRSAPRRVVVRIRPLAAPSSSFRCRPVPVVRLSTPVPVYRCR